MNSNFKSIKIFSVLIFGLIIFQFFAVCLVSAAQVTTPNFIIIADDPAFAQQVAQWAEYYRKQLAIEWLGKEMPNWAKPAVITIQVGPNLGAGGATTFIFDRGEVFGWKMDIQGSKERIIDSVLPHEISHMIFASHFRQPLPRWADEGASVSVERCSEKDKHRKALFDFLKTGRGIAFYQMFAMTEYPKDVIPLYAQGYSLAEFLIQNGGRRKYIEFLGDGMKSGNWDSAIQKHYGVKSGRELQNTWLDWVKQGQPLKTPCKDPTEPKPLSCTKKCELRVV